MVAQRGYRVLDSGIPLQYGALDECLLELDYEATVRAASVHMPRIGCGLAGGSWERVEPLIQKNLGYKDVYVYDL
jgi:O-acetyl-ADP-ribose deacetylase (regulator of RNase III)